MVVKDLLVLIRKLEAGTFVKSDNQDAWSRLGWWFSCHNLRCSLSYQYVPLYSHMPRDVPMPLSFVGVEVPAKLAFSSLSLIMVEAEGDLEKVLARGPRCVSLSSTVTHCVSRYGIQAIFKVRSCVALQPTSLCFGMRCGKMDNLQTRWKVGSRRWIGTYSW